MAHPNLRKLLNPGSVAIVGANDKGNYGARTLKNVIGAGFKGPIYPVNPNYETLNDRKCYPSLSALPEVPDTVIVSVPMGVVLPVIREAGRIGTPSMVVYSEGFLDLGTEEGNRRNAELTAIAARTGMAVQGPNCMGTRALRYGYSSSFGVNQGSIRAGGISIVSQSGGLINAFIELAGNRGIGFNYLIASGNEAVLTAADYLEWLCDDPETKVIICIVEGIKDGLSFRAALERAARAKPVAVLKLGRSEAGERATLAHTGSLAGDERIFAALCAQSGAILVDTIDAALETAAMFMRVPLPRGDNIVIFSTSGGATVLATDLATGLGLQFPPLSEASNAAMQRIFEVKKNFINPFDVTAQPRLARGNNMTRCLEALLADETFDLVGCVLIIQRNLAAGNQKLLDQVRAVAANASKPIILFPEATMHWNEAPPDPGVHVSSGLSDGLVALRALMSYAAFRRKLDATAQAEHPSTPPPTWPDDRRHVLTEFESKRLLAAAGMPITREALARTADEAVVTARRIGFPVALKVQSPDFAHKSDAGGVLLGLASETDVQDAFRDLVSGMATRRPDAVIDGVLVQEMVQGGVEVLVGMKRDPLFGPVVVVGPGGIFVELLGTAAQIRLPPLHLQDAYDMLQRSSALERLLAGFRGRPPADRTALARFIVDFARFVETLPDEIVAVDLNPVMVLPSGGEVKIVDAVFERAGAGNHR